MRKNGLYRRNYNEITDEELVKVIKRILQDDPYLGNYFIQVSVNALYIPMRIYGSILKIY